MFTGLIEEVGQIEHRNQGAGSLRLSIAARRILAGLKVGDSVSIDGACQTVVALEGNRFVVESVEETLQRTTFGSFRVGRSVNLERSLTLQDRLGGHLVLGHVDGVGKISRIEDKQDSWILTIEAPADLARYIAEKGSIAVDGISLTVATAKATAFTVSIIPHTFGSTTINM